MLKLYNIKTGEEVIHLSIIDYMEHAGPLEPTGSTVVFNG
jgi:hypothetical protein